MYTKEEVIHRIGEHNWEEFEIFMMGREIEYDENGFELYYVGDVSEFANDI